MRNRFLVAFMTLVLAGAAVTLVSAHGGDATKIHSCVNDSSGGIKIVGASDTCKTGETALDWNQQGPQGEVGPRGPQGEQGPRGIPGADSLYYKSSTRVFDTGPSSILVFCNNDDNADGTADLPTGGGYSVLWNPHRLGPAPDIKINVANLFYNPAFESSGYSLAFDNTTGEDIEISVSLVCASR
jgi:hypothetical protein